MTGTTTESRRVERALSPAEAQWWRRRAQSIRLHNPVAHWVGHLVEEAADTIVSCPGCRCHGPVAPILDHALWYHRLSYSDAAAWLEGIDVDLFSLAVHYLMTKDRSRTA
ncbi:MAG: hypothetical protein LC792_01690 [Actinobacteria bacterium]|nr:hypothetical protein [Actinomycetota bacterium]